ncbi:MAG: efflux RND transporter periplasmic adaptor subunit [bacterium]
MKNKWLWIGLVLVVVAAGVYFWQKDTKDKVQYRTAKVDRGNISVVISATGTVNADTTVQVGSQVSGRIAKLFVDFNSEVKRGELLAQLDPTFLQAALNQARAGVVKAQATLNQSQRDYERMKNLSSKDLVAQADLDAAITNLESAKATLEQANAGLDGARVNLNYATIRSPISGIVISRNVDVGQTVAASLSAPVLFEIANDLKKMQVKANVDEADIGNVKQGQEVTFRVDAFPNDEFPGTVREIRLAPVVTQNVVTYAVIIDVKNPALKLMPGMTATLSIIVASKDDILRVPIQATKFSPPNAQQLIDSTIAKMRARPDSVKGGGQFQRGPREAGARGAGRPKRSAVWTLAKNSPMPHMVGTGIQDGRYVELTRTDLKEGDDVVIGMTGPQSDTPQTSQNPFAPQSPGGGRRRSF